MRHVGNVYVSDVYDETALDYAVFLTLEEFTIHYSEVFFEETSINNLYIDDVMKIDSEVMIHL